MDSWKDVEAGLAALLSSPSACTKGPRLQEVCTALHRLIDSEDSGSSSVLSCVQCFIKTMELLAKLLLARKRARDWKQQEYSSRVSTALAAATAVLEHPSLLLNPVAAGKMGKRLLADTHLLPRVAAAHDEVAQLLTAHVQQQRPGDKQQQQQGQVLLLHVAELLLRWWLRAAPLWFLTPYRRSFAKAITAAAAQLYYAYHMQAVELAAAVVQAAGPNCTIEQLLLMAEVVHRVSAFHSSPDHPPILQEAAVARTTSVAYLRMVLLLLLTHSYCCNKTESPPPGAEPSGTNSTSTSSTSNSSTSNSSTSSTSRADSTVDSSTDSSTTGLAGVGSGVTGHSSPQQKQQQQQHHHHQQQQQRRQQLAATLADMWQQLVMPAASLAVFADAMHTDTELQVVLQASVDSHSGSSSSGGRSSGRTLFMPEDRPLLLRALGHIMHELHGVLLSTVDCPDPQVPAISARHQQLTRQQQQLLQAVGLQLPQVLLRTALLCGAGEPMLVARAAAASIFAVTCWRTACEMGDDWQLQQEQVLPGAFDCWLQLMQQVLLQQPYGNQLAASPAALFADAVAASADDGSAAAQHSSRAPHQQQQQHWPPAGLLLQAAGTARVLQGGSTAVQQLLDATVCSCTPAKDPPGDSSPCSSREFSCVSLACDSLLAVEALLECLGVFKGDRAGLLGSAGSVLLLLEVLARRVLPHHIMCSKSSSSERSGAAMRLSVRLCSALGQHGSLQALSAASLSQPQLQPRVVALVASLHKLTISPHVVRHSQQRFYLSLLGDTASVARLMIVKLHKAGVGDVIDRDLRTWRHMIATWVAIIGRYCWALGSQLSLWHVQLLEQQQEWQQWQQNLREVLDGSSGNHARLSAPAAFAEVSGVLGVLEAAQGLLGHEAMQKIESLWETCSVNPSSGDDEDDYVSIGSSCVLDDVTSMGPEYARAWQQWQSAAGQQLLPAYGSLAGEFEQLLQGDAVELLGLCKTLVGRAHKCVLALQQAGSGESPSISCNDPGDDIDLVSAACTVSSVDEWVEAIGAIYKAGSADGALQACLGFSGFAALGSELQAIGAGVCAKLPLPWLCNNPLCSSMGGASELQLVGGSSCVCGGCRVARYCGVNCQTAHWEQHKPVCRELAAAAAAAAQAAAADS